MDIPKECIEAYNTLTRAVKSGNYSEVDTISLDILKKTKYFYHLDKDMAPYSLLLDKIKEREAMSIGVDTVSEKCGPLANPACNIREKINKEFSTSNIFLDIPYVNYEDCEQVLRKDVLEPLGLKPIVAKDRLTSNAVLCKVCALIKTCTYGIADISSASNSVAYEYGLMHGLGMKVCLLLRSESEKFTDIHGLEHVPYNGLRSFKIAITKWIMDNVDNVDIKRAKDIIDTEEKILKDQGDVPLKEIKQAEEDIKEAEGYRQNIVKDIQKRSGSFKKKSKDKASRIIYSIPLTARREIISRKDLLNKRESYVLFPRSSAEFPFPSYKLETSQSSLACEAESDWRTFFRYFEVNIYGVAFFEESIYEYGKDDWDDIPKEEAFIDVHVTLDRLYKFVLLANRIYEAMGYSGLLTLSYLFHKAKGLKLISTGGMGFKNAVGEIKYDNDMLIKKDVDTEKLRESADTIILEIFEDFLASANVKQAYNRSNTIWNLEKVKWDLYGRDVCKTCGNTYKPQNQEKCLKCMGKV